MPKHVLEMLDNLCENGADENIKVLGEGVKASLAILDELKPSIELCHKHILDKELTQ